MPSGPCSGRHEETFPVSSFFCIFTSHPPHGNTTAFTPGPLSCPNLHLFPCRVPVHRERPIPGAFAKRLPVGRRRFEKHVHHADSLFLFPGVPGERKHRLPLDQPLRLQDHTDTGPPVHGARAGRLFPVRMVHRPVRGPAHDDRRGQHSLRLFYFSGGVLCHGHLRHGLAGRH